MYAIMDMVMKFHAKMGQPIGDPRAPDIQVEQDFRLALIDEELKELRIALTGYKRHPEDPEALLPFANEEDQLAEVAKELGDCLYLLVGCAVAWGLDMGAIMMEIHNSNMSKTPNPNGKAIKGQGYIPSNIKRNIRESIQEFEEAPDYFGNVLDERSEAIWHTPRKTRVGSVDAEIKEVQDSTRTLNLKIKRIT